MVGFFRASLVRRLPFDVKVPNATTKKAISDLQSVRRAFNQWIKALLQRRATASMIGEVVAVRDIFEEMEMLTEHKETWFDDEIEESFLMGREKGREEGREKGREEGLERGLERGREEALMSVARNMLKCGKSVQEIVEATGLQSETVQSLLH